MADETPHSSSDPMMPPDDMLGEPCDETVFTFAMIKPPTASMHAEAIYKRIKDERFAISNAMIVTLTAEEAEEFYSEHEGKPFFEGLVKHMCSGPCVLLRLHSTNSRVDPVLKWRNVIGPTNVQQAKEHAPDSIRAIFGIEGVGPANAVHGSDSAASAISEMRWAENLRSSAGVGNE